MPESGIKFGFSTGNAVWHMPSLPAPRPNRGHPNFPPDSPSTIPRNNRGDMAQAFFDLCEFCKDQIVPLTQGPKEEGDQVPLG